MSALLNAAFLTANPVRNGYRRPRESSPLRRVPPRSNDRIRGKLNAFFSHEPFPYLGISSPAACCPRNFSFPNFSTDVFLISYRSDEETIVKRHTIYRLARNIAKFVL